MADEVLRNKLIITVRFVNVLKEHGTNYPTSWHLHYTSEPTFSSCKDVYVPRQIKPRSLPTNVTSRIFSPSAAFCFLMEWGWVHLVLRPLFGLLHQSHMIDDGYCGAISGMRIGRGNRSTRRKRAPVHHKSHIMWPVLEPGPSRGGSLRLTGWVMARPVH
jgi:hypothetical protein